MFIVINVLLSYGMIWVIINGFFYNNWMSWLLFQWLKYLLNVPGVYWMPWVPFTVSGYLSEYYDLQYTIILLICGFQICVFGAVVSLQFVPATLTINKWSRDGNSSVIPLSPTPLSWHHEWAAVPFIFGSLVRSVIHFPFITKQLYYGADERKKTVYLNASFFFLLLLQTMYIYSLNVS